MERPRNFGFFPIVEILTSFPEDLDAEKRYRLNTRRMLITLPLSVWRHELCGQSY